MLEAGVLALRATIGEPDSDRRISYVMSQWVHTHVLDDAPILPALEDRLLTRLLRDYDADEPADVVGPQLVTEDEARELLAPYMNAFTEWFWPKNCVLMIVGAHVQVRGE